MADEKTVKLKNSVFEEWLLVTINKLASQDIDVLIAWKLKVIFNDLKDLWQTYIDIKTSLLQKYWELVEWQQNNYKILDMENYHKEITKLLDQEIEMKSPKISINISDLKWVKLNAKDVDILSDIIDFQ